MGLCNWRYPVCSGKLENSSIAPGLKEPIASFVWNCVCTRNFKTSPSESKISRCKKKDAKRNFYRKQLPVFPRLREARSKVCLGEQWKKENGTITPHIPANEFGKIQNKLLSFLNSRYTYTNETKRKREKRKSFHRRILSGIVPKSTVGNVPFPKWNILLSPKHNAGKPFPAHFHLRNIR